MKHLTTCTIIALLAAPAMAAWDEPPDYSQYNFSDDLGGNMEMRRIGLTEAQAHCLKANSSTIAIL